MPVFTGMTVTRPLTSLANLWDTPLRQSRGLERLPNKSNAQQDDEGR
jgi:hypothetical protein